MKRRHALGVPLSLALPISLAAASIGRAAEPASANAANAANAALTRLRAGGCALLLRHASTDPGIGDPPGFRLGDCSTQRNLSPAGRAEAQRIGAWFAARALAPSAVRSSAWCRCQDTATLAFGRPNVWPAINSHFGRGAMAPEAMREVRRRLAAISAGQFEVWVMHQVTITALIGEYTDMGRAWLVAPGAGQSERPEVVAGLAFDG